MEEKEKLNIKLKLATCFRKVIEENKHILNSGSTKNTNLIDGIRQLEAASGLSYTIVQGVTVGKRDPQFTTLIGLIETGLNMSFTEFARIYDSITNEEITKARSEIANSKRKIGEDRSKKSLSKKK